MLLKPSRQPPHQPRPRRQKPAVRSLQDKSTNEREALGGNEYLERRTCPFNHVIAAARRALGTSLALQRRFPALFEHFRVLARGRNSRSELFMAGFRRSEVRSPGVHGFWYQAKETTKSV